MTKEQLKMNITMSVGWIPAEVIFELLDQYETRIYYKDWILPNHKKIMDKFKMKPGEYYYILDHLISNGLLVKMKDKKVKKLLYSVNLRSLL